MPKYNRRRSHSRNTNLKIKLTLNSSAEKERNDCPSEDEPELLYSADEWKNFDFTAKEMLENISTLYTLCAESVSQRYFETVHENTSYF